VSNPLSAASSAAASNAPPPTQTIPQREVYHSIQAEIRPLMVGIQTREQLDRLQAALNQIQLREEIHDPRIVLGKGRPRTERLTGPTEGRPRGGGAGAGMRNTQRPQYQAATISATAKQVAKRQNNCSVCHQPGHNRTSCPERR
ncbi:hypothetical protein FB451DRAFT_1054219, partial [Mycena latifolia]